MGSYNSVRGILNVRGDREVRTTVSRSGLEQDDAYARLTQACVEMLYEHIEAEVGRIADEPGRPLSQASTAAGWLVSDLSSLSEHGKKCLDAWVARLQFIVVEEVEQRDVSITTSRRMVSPETLAQIPTLWTVESRLVDTLGIISRDMGRELSVNEFLSALAPEIVELAFSPLMPDALPFADGLRLSHAPERALFSVERQQSVVAWCVRHDQPQSWIDIQTWAQDKDFLDRVTKICRAAEQFSLLEIEPLRVDIAPIEGDDERIDGITTRIGVICRPGSDFADIWHSVRSAAHCLSIDQNDPVSLAFVYTVSRSCFGASNRAPAGRENSQEIAR